MPKLPWRAAFAAASALMVMAAGAGADGFAAWAHAADYRLDTRAQGADAQTATPDFPVLLRLDSTNFSFAEAAADGSDLRVSGSDDAPFAFQVERWDGPGRRAALWIRVPSIPGQSDAGILRLHWGNAAAKSASDGKAVFDSALGWAGVWHLGDGQLADAAGSSPPADGSHSAPAEGLIAGGRALAGNNEGLLVADAPALDPVSALTLTLWMRPDSWAGAAKSIVQKGTAPIQYALLQDGNDSLAFVLGGVQGGATVKAALPSAGAWHWVAATYDGARSALYIDGRLASSVPASGALAVGGEELCLGCRAAQGKPRNSFKGILDEPTVSRIARGADFIRLAYANQRAQQTLVRKPDGVVACVPSFRASADTAVPEGSMVTLRGSADCATAWYWSALAGPAPRILDPEVLDLPIAIPRITQDTVLRYRFTARYGDSLATRDVAVRIREAIPDPQFALEIPASWNGRDSLVLRPIIANLAALRAGPDSVVRIAWTISDPSADTSQAKDALILRRAAAGSLRVGVCLDNGGAPHCLSGSVTVDPGAGTALKPGPLESRPKQHRNLRDALGRSGALAGARPGYGRR